MNVKILSLWFFFLILQRKKLKLWNKMKWTLWSFIRTTDRQTSWLSDRQTSELTNGSVRPSRVTDEKPTVTSCGKSDAENGETQWNKIVFPSRLRKQKVKRKIAFRAIPFPFTEQWIFQRKNNFPYIYFNKHQSNEERPEIIWKTFNWRILYLWTKNDGYKRHFIYLMALIIEIFSKVNTLTGSKCRNFHRYGHWII